MSVWANFADIIRGECVTEVCEAERNQLTDDWSTANDLFNRPSGVQIPRDILLVLGVICTLLGAVR